jgi:hypothetical protein
MQFILRPGYFSEAEPPPHQRKITVAYTTRAGQKRDCFVASLLAMTPRYNGTYCLDQYFSFILRTGVPFLK